MFRWLILLLLAFAVYRFCRGVWCGYYGRPVDGANERHETAPNP